jgi:hypothetical protein
MKGSLVVVVPQTVVGSTCPHASYADGSLRVDCGVAVAHPL